MNPLQLVPVLGDLIDKIVPNPNERDKLKLELREIESRENCTRMGALTGMFRNRNLFVSGAIPAILWIVAIAIFNNYVLLPWAGVFGKTVPAIELPTQVWTLAGWIITGLLGKKVVDDNEWYRKDGTLLSPSKKMVESNINKGVTSPVGQTVPPVVKNDEYYDARVKEEIEKVKRRMNNG